MEPSKALVARLHISQISRWAPHSTSVADIWSCSFVALRDLPRPVTFTCRGRHSIARIHTALFLSELRIHGSPDWLTFSASELQGLRYPAVTTDQLSLQKYTTQCTQSSSFCVIPPG